MDEIVVPTVRGLAREGAPYRGILYVGLMLTKDGPKVIEFNCRWGDPECQVLMARAEIDVVPLLLAAARGTALPPVPSWGSRAAVCVAIASGGYPGNHRTGLRIEGLTEAGSIEGVQVFHAGTAERQGGIVTAGGRVLAVTAAGPDLGTAIARAYEAVGKVRFDGMHFRRDIGRMPLRRPR
jgi:phosphoribosylamine--glycine ligase